MYSTVCIYTQSRQSAKRFSSRWNWDSPTPLAAGECAPPPFGSGVSQFQRGDIHCGAIYILVGFGRACAPVRCAHPSFWAYCHINQGAARLPAHRSFAASYSTPKNIYNLSNLGRLRQGFFSFNGNTEAMKYEVPCHCPTHRSFAGPSGNILGSKCTGATIRPNYFNFSFFVHIALDLFFSLFSFFSSLLFHFFLFISSYLSLLTSSYRYYSSSSYSSLLIF